MSSSFSGNSERTAHTGESTPMTKKVFKWWWAWKAEKIEHWLEEQAAEGWILKSCSLAGTIFRFHKEEPKRIRCIVDYLYKLSPEYEQVLTDDGWDLLVMGGGWYLCCREYGAVPPNLYSDIPSLMDRNHRLISVLTATGIPLVVMMPVVFKFQGSERLQAILTIFWIPVLILYIFGMIRLWSIRRALKEKQDLSGL